MTFIKHSLIPIRSLKLINDSEHSESKKFIDSPKILSGLSIRSIRYEQKSSLKNMCKTFIGPIEMHSINSQKGTKHLLIPKDLKCMVMLWGKRLSFAKIDRRISE